MKLYRFTCRVTTGTKTTVGYNLEAAESEREARARFSELHDHAEFLAAHKARAKSSDFPIIEILAVDEIEGATLRESREGADLSTIPALRRLPHKSLVITPADSPGCESGWVRRVLRDAEGNNLHDNLKVVGCRSYMETPPQGAWYRVSSSDDKLGVLLCQEHLAENFPEACAAVKKRLRVSRA